MSQSKQDNDQKSASNNNQAASSNPFRSSASRFGRSSSSSVSSSKPQAGSNNQHKAPPRFGSLGSRFGSSHIEFEIRPVHHTFVRFELAGLGDPFHRLLGTELNMAHSDPKHILETVRSGGDSVQALATHLETAWLSYELTGAAMIFEWQDEIRQVIGIRSTSNSTTDNREEDFDDDDAGDQNPEPTSDTPTPPTCLRAIDHALVMNVLARTRSGILIAKAKMSLEAGFLDRSLISDDPRLVALARATGCLEEKILV